MAREHEPDSDLLAAHIAARNAAHHSNVPVVEIDQGTGIEPHARWSPDSPVKLKYPNQQALYERLIRGQPVFPALKTVTERVLASIPDS